MIETSVYVRYYDLEDYNRSTVRVGVQYEDGMWIAKYVSPRKCRWVETESDEPFHSCELAEFVIETEKALNAYVVYDCPPKALVSKESYAYQIPIYRLSHESDGVLFESFGGMRDACELMADYLAEKCDDYLGYMTDDVWDAVYYSDSKRLEKLKIKVEQTVFNSDDGILEKFPFVRCPDDVPFRSYFRE